MSGPYLHVLEIADLSQCDDDIEEDTTTFGISCIKDLLGVHDIHVWYPSDVHRVREDAKAVARASGIDTQDADVITLTNATLLTMNTGSLHTDFISDGVLVIRGGIIERVGSAREVAVPPGGISINTQGGEI